jgi:fumarylacetoacetate (FAA) hydrolase family protein
VGRRRDVQAEPHGPDGGIGDGRLVLRPGLRLAPAGAVLQSHAARVSGHGQPLRIRKDSDWNVPEPELTLVLSSRLKLVGFTVGNDMSSRDIEGDNPLYLPQAKCYDQCCGLGPWITLPVGMPPRSDIGIR